jgi:RHS repeat-associated protein
VVGLMNWNGAIETWDIEIIDTNLLIYGTNYFTRSKEYRGELVKRDDLGVFQWTTPDRLIYTFRHPFNSPQVMKGRLLKIQDFNGNTVQLQWNQSIGVLTQVVDSVNGVYKFNYNAGFTLTNVTFGAWQMNFGYDTSNRLASKTLTNTSGLYTAVNITWQFAYNSTNGLLERIIDPRGNTNVFVQYDKYGRKTNEVDALGRASRTEYGVPAKRQVRRTDPGGFVWLETYDRKGHLLAQQDPLTNITSYAYDTNGNRISITERLGWTTTFGYDTRANVVARTNALGEVTRWVFDPFFNKAVQQITPQPLEVNGSPTWTNFYAYDTGGNLTNHADGLGTLVRYSYATNGLVLTATDANGKTTRFGYDTNGFLITRTDPATNTWTFTVNDVGWKTAELNPLGQRTAYTLDLNGNAVLTVDPVFREFAKTFDANGNLLTASDGKGNITRFGYDAANQKTNMVDRTGTNIWTYFYTTRGKPDRIVNPLGYARTNFYDAANRLVAMSDPLGNTTTNQYDANGNITATIDPVGQRWTKTYDRLNRVVAETDPQGDSKQTSYDVAGRIAQITTPIGYPSTHTYDGRGRLIKWVDAENYHWLYDYDGNANITNITDALNGHYVMTYGPRNERTLERNQDNQSWIYAYDELLRLKTQTDPNGTVRSVIYDTAGRIQTVNFSTSRQDSYEYDPNNNLKVVTRRVGGVPTTTGFNYDVLDRVTKVTDAFYFDVGYGYDALGRATSITYPGNKVLTQKFDAVNRLTNQVDWAGRTMNYAYDKAGRLIWRSYPNGVVQTNTFDTAGQITGLTYSGGTGSNALNIALAYAYDRNGNKVGGGEKGTFQWPLPTLATEQAHFTLAGRLIDRQINNTVSNQLLAITYAYDPSGNMTNATGQGQTWALTYDEDNRTTSIRWDAGITSKNITNRYDALGRRVAKTVDGVESRFVLDLSGGMERVLCEADASGNIRAWYVHGPDLCYRVDATNALTCYHADAMANIIALTDVSTNLVARFAYTPYGRSLGSTNSSPSAINSQPYTFVGSQGVMEELPGLYFMRARYYSADAGVFLSPDPVKKIGPGWKPTAYGYANGNPLGYMDPAGELSIDIASYPAAFIYGFLKRTTLDVMAGFGVAVHVVILGTPKDIAISSVTEAMEFLENAIDSPLKDSFVGESLFSDKAVEWGEKASLWAQAQALKNVNSRGAPGMNSDASGQRQAGYLPATQTKLQNIQPNTPTPQSVSPRVDFSNGNSPNTGGGASMSGRTVAAANQAQSLNSQQQTNPVRSSNGTGTTSQSIANSGNSSSSGNSAFTRVVTTVSNAVTTATNAISSAVQSVAQTVSSWASSAWSFITGGRR